MKAPCCLAIETSTSRASVAVNNGSQVFVTELADDRESSRTVYQSITVLLAEAGLAITELECVGFGCGPGSFTGVRVATSVAQGIAYSRSLPVCPVSSLAAVAMRCANTERNSLVAACLDARMGEAYLAVYDVQKGRQPLMRVADQLVNPANFVLPQLERTVLAAGPGWRVWPELGQLNATAIESMVTDAWPSAADVLAIAQGQFAAGAAVEARDALPNYVRNKVTQ